VDDEIAIIFGTTRLVPFASSSALLTIRKASFLSSGVSRRRQP
jgi:hypothetical protein